MDFKIRENAWYDHGKSWWFISNGSSNYLWKDGEIYKESSGFFDAGCIEKAGGYWSSREEAERFLTNYEEKQMSERLEQVKKDISLLKAEQAKIEKKIEEDKKYVFKAGDVAIYGEGEGRKRIILWTKEGLTSYNKYASLQGTGQAYFERYNYKKVGRLEDYLK